MQGFVAHPYPMLASEASDAPCIALPHLDIKQCQMQEIMRGVVKEE